MLLHLIRRRCTNSAFLSFRIQKRYAKIEFAFSGVDFNNGQKLRSFSTGAVTKSYHEGTENFESYKDLEKDIDLNNSIALRSYQKECIDTICKTLSNGASKIAVSIATGGGKTVIFCKTIPTLLKIRRYDGDISNGILVLVHRRELAKQTIDTILRMNIVDKDRVFLDMGTSALDPKIFLDNRPFIVVGSVPTLARNDCKRLACYNKSKFKAVIVDECHHAVSKSYLDIFNTMNCSKELHGKPSDHKDGEIGPFLLGFTATLARADKQPLKKAFDEIVFQKGILSLIEENHLCDLEWLRVEIGLNLSKVEVQGGDFNTASLAQHVNTDEVNSIVLKSYIQMKTRFPDNMNSLLAFCVNVKHMQDLSLLFQANGINAQYVSGETKISERDAIIHDFKRGKVPVLFNCGVFTEGTDIPNIDSIFLVRPTKSKPLLIQMIGRGLRLHEGKKKLLVTDFVDNKSLGLTITSTLGGKSEILSLLGGTTGTGFNHRNEMLGGDVDYIKFARFSGKELFDENPDKQNPAYVLMQKMRLLNSKSALGNWIQVKFNTWATPCGYKSYLKIESDQNGKYKAHYCFSKLGFKDSIRLISTTIAEDPNFTDVIDSVKEYVVKHEFINDEMKAISLRESHMKHASITKSQRNFIANTVMDIVEKSQSYAMDMDKFKKVFNEKVESMSRLEASDFIFGFTVGRKQSAMIWIKQNFLRNKNQRALITKETVLQEKQALMDGGWT